MPKSRNRKKKKKTSKRKGKNKSPNVFLRDGIEFIKEGKKIFINNKRTQAEHEAFLAKMMQSRPEMLIGINAKIERVISLFAQYDIIKLLGGITYHQIENLASDSGEPLWEVTLEYALSFATAIKIGEFISPSPEIIYDLIENLRSIRETYNYYVMSEFVTGNYTDIEGGLRYKTITEALFVRGEGYTKHVNEIYLQLFEGHNDFLKSQYGFTANDILETVLQLENSFMTRIDSTISHQRFLEWNKLISAANMPTSDKNFLELFAMDNPDIEVTNNRVIGYRLNDLGSYNQLFKVRFRKPTHKEVVAQISMTPGENSEFLTPKFRGLPLTESKIYTKPIIKIRDEYYCFSFSLPSHNLIQITEQLIKDADINYYNNKYLGNTYALSRDNFLEEKGTQLFKKTIPECNAYPNVKYQFNAIDSKGQKSIINTELDLLISSPKALYLIEMKAGGLSAPAKRGALKTLTGQLEDSVGYAAYQSYRAYQHILNSPSPMFYDEKGSEIKIDYPKKIFRITITLENLSGLVAYLYDLKELGVIDKSVPFAWTINIFDLQIFSEILETEQDFIDYLEKRIPLYENPKLRFHDEIDLLGYFLDENLVFDEELISKLDTFQLNNYSKEIDDYFQLGSAKPKRKNN